MIEVHDREKAASALKKLKPKQVRISPELMELVGKYRDCLVEEQGADPEAFTDERLILLLVAEGLKDKDFQRWLGIKFPAKPQEKIKAVATAGERKIA